MVQYVEEIEKTQYKETASSLVVGNTVKVKELKETDIDDMQLEDYYYLLDFAKKKGVIVKINDEKRINYQVEFSNSTGLFYAEDLEILE